MHLGICPVNDQGKLHPACMPMVSGWLHLPSDASQGHHLATAPKSATLVYVTVSASLSDGRAHRHLSQVLEGVSNIVLSCHAVCGHVCCCQQVTWMICWSCCSGTMIHSALAGCTCRILTPSPHDWQHEVCLGEGGGAAHRAGGRAGVQCYWFQNGVHALCRATRQGVSGSPVV